MEKQKKTKEDGHYNKLINGHWDAFPFLLQSNTIV